MNKINELYPLRGKILQADANEIHLNIGQMAGVKMGRMFKVHDKDVTLKIIAVSRDKSLAKVEKGVIPSQKGLRVQAL